MGREVTLDAKTVSLITTLVGAVLAIGIGLADRWAFNGSFGQSWDVGMVGAGVGALLGTTGVTIGASVAAARSNIHTVT